MRREPDSPYAALRLAASLAIMVFGTGGMFVVPVVLPFVQADFGLGRAEAAMPYAAMMIGFGFGSLAMGRAADRFGLVVPVVVASLALGLGFVSAALTHAIGPFAVLHGVLIGLLGCAATFAPLLSDTSLWWGKRRGIAVAICASGNFIGGAIWPTVIQHAVETWGWRSTYMGFGLASAAAIASLALVLRGRPAAHGSAPGRAVASKAPERPFGLAPNTAQALLCVAGVACCVAMAMPQVHIVAYCGDLGFGPARGAEMLALMLACGVASRLVSGVLCDRIGGLRTLMIGSALQCVALALFLPVKGLASLYAVCALFGLFQGGIVPSYAIVVREFFPAGEAGGRVGALIMATMFGMALGGWMSGRIFDFTGSYRAAFVNGIAWNLLNFAIVAGLYLRTRRAAPRIAAACAPAS